MKKFLGALALTFALLGTSLYAQAPEKKDCCKKETKACDKKEAKSCDKKTACADVCTNDCRTKGEVCKCGEACCPKEAVATKGCCKGEADKAKACDKKGAKADKKTCDKKHGKKGSCKK